MSFFISEHFSDLPGFELRRVQMRMRLILKQGIDASQNRKAILNSLKRFGSPTEHFRAMSPENRQIHLKLLNAFGTLTISTLSENEIQLLKESAFTIWPKEQLCLISGEAYQYFCSDRYFREEGYLFAHLKSLSLRERKAWAEWLGVNSPIRTETERLNQLYLQLGELQSSTAREPNNIPLEIAAVVEKLNRNQPLYLDEIFPDNPANCPVAWFYRGILSLYDSLARLEKSLEPEAVPAHQILQALKCGLLVTRSHTPGFGQKERYYLVPTREKYSENNGKLFCDLTISNTKENLLF